MKQHDQRNVDNQRGNGDDKYSPPEIRKRGTALPKTEFKKGT